MKNKKSVRIRINQDTRFIDENGMPKGRQKINQERTKLINNILKINIQDLQSEFDFDIKEKDKIKQNALQKLKEFDNYYIKKH